MRTAAASMYCTATAARLSTWFKSCVHIVQGEMNTVLNLYLTSWKLEVSLVTYHVTYHVQSPGAPILVVPVVQLHHQY